MEDEIPVEDLIDLCDDPQKSWPWIILLLFWWLL